ncbi:MAG: hypothetical protein ABIY52_16080 [Gemmatimonadaceae bacterium]
MRGVPLEVLRYPLLSAIAGRRTRRVARGVSVAAGTLSHTSTNAPAPLEPVEEAMLIVATGLTGVVTHDGPLDIPGGGRELGTPFLHVMARSASSPDNIQAVHFIMINDAGTWLIENLTPARAMELLRDLPPKWEDWSASDWTSTAEAMKKRIGDRLTFPRRFPFYLGWNKQLSNMPGTTMFLPIVDCTRGYINALLNLAMEPDGERPLFIDDFQHFKPESATDLAASFLQHIGKVQIPYQPIGGTKYIHSGYVNPKVAAPLGLFRTFIADHESHFHLQNLMLLTQAMGLGAWVHFCPASPFIFEGDGTKEHPGLGFTMQAPGKTWGMSPPPPPSWMPNPIGIPGILEGNTPPFVSSMDAAVDAVLEAKFGPGGAYDPSLLQKGYASPSMASQFVREGQRYDDRAVAYVKDVCNYIYDTYGRFPAHVDAFYVPGTWLQVSHPELEYYERTVPAEMFARQHAHAAMWGEGPSSP